jgi:(1->4)-alpha-D-glucan 1-alpha-D-glucosylmutase
MLRATYRVQLNAQFGFDELRRALPYLHRLGISHLYLSPVFHSRQGSTHGYDLIDHGRIDPDLGGREGFEALVAACRELGMGLVLDIVPNHMAVLGAENAWWMDVLENGPASSCAKFFDIDWTPVRQTMRNRLLVPILGAPLGEVVERGEVRVVFRPESGIFLLNYFEHWLPVEPRSYPMILRAGEGIPGRSPALGEDAQLELASLMDAFAALPPPLPAESEVLQVRYRDRQVNQRRLARLCAREPAVLALIQVALERINAPSPDPELLDRLLQAQPYRLAFWRVSGEEINYRRFFDVNDLAAVRMEDAEVFEATHGLLRALWQQRLIDGVRVDHADGLYDPAEYFRRLRDVLVPDAERPQPWVVVEKILGAGEKLRTDWSVDGTTGYEFNALVTGWLTQPAGVAELDRIWRRQVGGTEGYGEIVYQSKRQVMHTSLAAEISGLAARLDRLAQMHWNTRDFTLFDLRAAIVEVIACFPVYRTYITGSQPGAEDVQHVRRAIGAAFSRKRSSHRALEFLERVLLGELEGSSGRAEAALEFTQKFQQVTSPVMAKGVEDTAFYRFARYLPMNEVGSEPDARGLSTELLHRANEERAREWPRTMLSTATHDSKRGEDVRWRLCVLSEIAHEWAACVGRWRRLKRHHRREPGAPEVVQEYLLLQSLLGIWPANADLADMDALRERLCEYAIKAAREAKQATSWLDPDEEVERGLRELVARMLPEQGAAGFERYFRPVIDPVLYFGMFNALAALVLKLTAPGIPDFYQGTELPSLVLVDPDNRRPVDLDAHAAQLAAIDALAASRPLPEVVSALLSSWQDGRLKMYVTRRLLALRASHADAFSGDYLALSVEGARGEHVCAYARQGGDCTVIALASRWTATLCGGELKPPVGEAIWQDTAVLLAPRIPAGRYVDVLSGQVHEVAGEGEGRRLPAARLFELLPCCVLVRQPEGS